MYRIIYLTLSLILAGAAPAFAEGFSHTQFVLLIVVNLALGAVVTLFLAVLASVLLQKIKTKKMESPIPERRAVPRGQVE